MADFGRCASCGKTVYIWTGDGRWMWKDKNGAVYCSEECRRAARLSAERERRQREKELSETKAK